jgi:hypothetical protein
MHFSTDLDVPGDAAELRRTTLDGAAKDDPPV